MHVKQPVTRLIVHGATGRVGSRICELSGADPGVRLVACLARRDSSRLGSSCCPRADAPRITADPAPGAVADVVVDFTRDSGVSRAISLTRDHAGSLLVGTTGLSRETLDELRALSRERAVLVCPNTSLGVAVTAHLVRLASSLLPGADCSIVEAHHNKKVDAPSGTALRLGEAARAGGATVDPGQILAVRGGDVIGEHTVRFALSGELVEITHRATTRDLFALGAIRAAHWLRGRAPGWWTMEDVLQLPAASRANA